MITESRRQKPKLSRRILFLWIGGLAAGIPSLVLDYSVHASFSSLIPLLVWLGLCVTGIIVWAAQR